MAHSLPNLAGPGLSQAPQPLQPHVESVLSPAVPATPDEGADGSCLGPAVPRAPFAGTVADYPFLLDASLPQPVPLPSAPASQPLETPPPDDRPQLDLGFAAALPLATALPTPTVFRTAHNLRLPSFDVLGIAAPHPDRIPLRPDQPLVLGAGPLSKPEDPLHALSPTFGILPTTHAATDPLSTSPKAARAQVEHIVPTFTPPSEPGTISWGSFVNVRTAGVGSPPSSDPGVSPNLGLGASAAEPGQAPIVVPTHAEVDSAVRMAAWMQEIKNLITIESGCLDLPSVKVLSHALPCPSLAGHMFGQLIAQIHERTTTITSWINVFHAVPGRYTLSDLPKSPPSTPGPAVGGDNYFTSKVFDSAVAIPDYQLDSKLLPPSPRPVVPPRSINISAVERYIPPTNTNEYAEMFSLRGRSLLYDRLIELSADNGILLFIYPTKTGGRTFMQDYLSPIIDPLLRTVTVVHDLHSELGRNLGQMAAINYLDEYPNLEAQVRTFCAELSNLPGNTNTNNNNNNNTSTSRNETNDTYHVLHAAKESVLLDRAAWADDWWIKQEKPRVRDVITKYFRKSKKLPTDEMSGAQLIQEVLDGVSRREYARGAEPRSGVEVGVFVVKKMAGAAVVGGSA